MKHTELRERFRAILTGSRCISPASVYDPLSAKIAESVGYEVIQVGGSIASRSILAAPDVVVLTLTELAESMRRIMRVANTPLLVDSDHGYGNALNVMRTIQELEHAGVSALTIEDTLLPVSYGQKKGELRLVSVEEGVGKMRAAVAARGDAALVIGARTSALRVEGLEGTLKRLSAYAKCGVDTIFLEGLDSLEQMQAIHEATRLPIIVGAHRSTLTREELKARGARMLLQGHLPIAAAIKAMRDSYAHICGGGAPSELKDKVASPEEIDQLMNTADYQRWLNDYLR